MLFVVPFIAVCIIVPVGASNRFSYTTTRAGTTSTIKWVSYTQVVSIAWS